ncbi:MAG: type III-B CRISPR-associated protein Cas10/Cmr2 [Candidatus Bathyarchaeota archaeon]|nr:type III-B CRISPR-associated protein Cas10/Cmr2 [Candidatus Bathyarchaeota archaeon]
MSSELNFLRLCALLHDVGKPECWANRRSWSEHAYYTFKLLQPVFGDAIASAAMRHHTGAAYPHNYHPKSEAEWIICLADNLSSGADRRDEPASGSPLPAPPIELTHVLSNKVVESLDAPHLSYSVRELIDVMQQSKGLFNNNPRKGYLKVFEIMSKSSFVRIPADTRRPINDVSLFDHLKLTAAFATCMWFDGGFKGESLDDYEFALLCGDADKISRFVNISVRLPDLNARSEVIKQATEKAKAVVVEALGPECVLFAGGGGLLALSPVCKASELSELVRIAFERETQDFVKFTVNHLFRRGLEIQREFGKIWEEAQRQMRLKKHERVAEMFSSLDFEVAICDVCHRRPASKLDVGKLLVYDATARAEQLCEACWRLRSAGEGARIDDLKDAANWVGLIKMDGDDVGRLLSGDRFKALNKASTPSRLSSISRLINETCEGVMTRVVHEAGGKCLVAGGDDVLALVPGEKALGAAGKMAAAFKQAMDDGCTVSCGVAVFHYKLPIYVALEAVERLLKLAKEAEGKDSVAFAFICGGGLIEDKKMHKPRKWRELSEILRLASFMQESGVAASQLRKIAETYTKSPLDAEVLVKRLMGRGEQHKGLSWGDGLELLHNLKSGILLDAFMVYNAFKV